MHYKFNIYITTSNSNIWTECRQSN